MLQRAILLAHLHIPHPLSSPSACKSSLLPHHTQGAIHEKRPLYVRMLLTAAAAGAVTAGSAVMPADVTVVGISGGGGTLTWLSVPAPGNAMDYTFEMPGEDT